MARLRFEIQMKSRLLVPECQQAEYLYCTPLKEVTLMFGPLIHVYKRQVQINNFSKMRRLTFWSFLRTPKIICTGSWLRCELRKYRLLSIFSEFNYSHADFRTWSELTLSTLVVQHRRAICHISSSRAVKAQGPPHFVE